jgi:hypothetical protein
LTKAAIFFWGGGRAGAGLRVFNSILLKYKLQTIPP